MLRQQLLLAPELPQPVQLRRLVSTLRVPRTLSLVTDVTHTHRDNWAKTISKNKNVKIYVGGLASPTAGSSGYVDQTTFINIALAARDAYSSFGGVMFWDASQAWSASSTPSDPCPMSTS